MFFSIKNTSGLCEQKVPFVWPVLGAGRAGRVGWLCQGDSHTFVVVVPDGLGVLVPEVVVHDHVQPLGVEVHVPLGVRLQVVDMKVLSLLDDPVMVVQGGGLLQVAAARWMTASWIVLSEGSGSCSDRVRGSWGEGEW